jgi:glyoxylase-like metal-dependent hydrolase (beta-lactamase superfamily II)
MPDHTITLGNVELVSLSDGFPLRSPLTPFPDTKIEQWREFPGLLDGNDQYTTRYGTVAVRSEGKLIIVDTGLQEADGTLMDDMKAKGIDPAAVDLVVFTHLHPDHVGWNLTNGRPNFPNARYLAPRRDWDYWSQPEVAKNAAHITNQVLPLNDLKLLDFMDDDHKITGELTTVNTPGHTPGHISINIFSSGERGYILGDVAHNLAQAHYTDWCPIFDIDPEVSRKTRHQVLDMLEAEGIMVSAGHFPHPGFGHFVRKGSRRVWQGI